MIHLDNDCHWLYAAVKPETNKFLYVKLSPTRTTALTKLFMQELTEKHDVEDSLFLIDSAPWLKAVLHDFNLRFQTEPNGNRNAIERIFKELKIRTKQFANHFKHADAETAENWLQTFAFTWNQLI